MRPPKFDYYRPTSLADAINVLATNDNAKALAGGHSLIPAMNLRLATPDLLVDVSRLDDLRGIGATDGVMRIGALATHAEIAASAQIRTHGAALAAAARQVGDPHVRNWGTLGGNIAHADPAADLPTAVLACGGIIHVQGPDGARRIAADDFFIDLFTVDLMPGELIVVVDLPVQPNARSAYAKFPHPASHYALVGVAVSLVLDEGRCQSARVAVGGSLPKATRSTSAEAVLAGATLDEGILIDAANALLDDVAGDLMGDIFASEDYRAAMLKVYFKRAVRAASGQG